MALRDIQTFPNTVLRNAAKPVVEVDDDIRNLVDDMIETMHSAPGVGLAAPQVGVSLQIIVVDTSVGDDPDALIVLINPEIVSQSGNITLEEGCLSLPGIVSDVNRYNEVTVRGSTLDGELVEIEVEGFLARVFQHELDHLNGSLYWDRLGKIRRGLLKREYKKILEDWED